MGVTEEQALHWFFSFQVLNFFGLETYDGMLTSCHYRIERVEEHDGDCGPLPNYTMTWGHIKATYR